MIDFSGIFASLRDPAYFAQVLKGMAQSRLLLYFTELELPLRCGVPILQALELLRSRIPDVVLQKRLAIASRQIQAGQTLS